MDISIIVPVYGVEAYIEECLRSVMAQEDIDDLEIECLVVDDCGPDRSMEIARKVIESYDGPIEFRIITREANGGLSAARNSGIREARGKYVYFLDSDDLISSDAMSRLWKTASSFSYPQIVTGKFVNFPGKTQIRTYQLRDFHGDSEYRNLYELRALFLTKYPVIACNKFISRQFIIDAGLTFREGIIHEDDNWTARAYHHIKHIAICDRITYKYRLRVGSITSGNFTMKSLNGYMATAKEMFAICAEWDRPWMFWTLGVLDSLKLWRGDEGTRKKARIGYKNALKTLLNNKAVPFRYKLVYLYHNLPRPFMSVVGSYYLVKLMDR